MKIGFLLQRRFAYAGHAMAMAFREKYGVEQFCGFVQQRDGYHFLKFQTDIPYTALLLDEDIHSEYAREKLDLTYIQTLEREYGIPNLWLFIDSDRIARYGQLVREYPHDTPRYSHEDMLRIVQTKAKAIIRFLETERPDCIIFSGIGCIGSMLLYHIARKKGIRTFYMHHARIENRFALNDQCDLCMNFAEKIFGELQKNPFLPAPHNNWALRFLMSFRERPVPPFFTETPEFRPVTRARQLSFLKPTRAFRSAFWVIKSFYDYARDPHRDDFQIIKPWHYVWDRIRRKMRNLVGFSDLYDTMNFREDFAFYPLQIEPEVVSLVLTPFYRDQLWLAKQIARSLPVHFKLYIKEHPAMCGYRARSFYKELKKIPNVKLIDPRELSFPITQNAKLVLTTTGTTGWEAVLLKKPVITFGDVFFNVLPMVKRCRDIETLPHLAKEQLENFHYDENALLNLLSAIYQESADADLFQLWEIDGGSNMEKKTKAVVPLVDLIAQKLELKQIHD